MPKPRKTTIGLVVATLLCVGYVMFVPARNYFDQQAATREAEDELERLDQEMAQLREREAQLEDPDHIVREARERFNLGYPGEEVYAVLPAPPAALPIPTGWPFDSLRGAAAAGTVATPPGN
ncbi:MAG TPA: septum formation initiator family protein [Acidimicrobiales bacterium]|nr:septum formation initiator family protein [Acidimicrobiales bacterium]